MTVGRAPRSGAVRRPGRHRRRSGRDASLLLAALLLVPVRAAALPEDANWDPRFVPRGTGIGVDALAWGGAYLHAACDGSVLRWDGTAWTSLGTVGGRWIPYYVPGELLA